METPSIDVKKTVPNDNEYRQQRLAHMEELRKRGRDPFGRRFDRDGLIAYMDGILRYC